MTPKEFSELRYGMFVHFGLYSLLGRGEWVMNREQISPAEMEGVAASFDPVFFDAEEICRLAVDGGMKYIVFTTMHHEGFRMYPSALSSFNSWNHCHRDFTGEIVNAARKYGLKIGLYHSLNNWHDQPDAVAALEDKKAYDTFIANTFARLSELVSSYSPIDILWYDGWWPFNAEEWQAEKMNEAMRKIQSHLIFNGRNCLPGDFGTPEQHLTPPSPWRPWEACVTLNDHWGFHPGDQNWKTPLEVIDMLISCANGRGNLLLNIGPAGDGSIPAKSAEVIRTTGQWLSQGGYEALTDCEPMPFSATLPQPGDRGDWDSQGRFTASGNNLFLIMKYFPGTVYTLTGLSSQVKSAIACGNIPLKFEQKGGKLQVELPEVLRSKTAPVIKFVCDRPPVIYRTGGMRVPEVPHPRYDPVTPDIQY